MTGKLITFEGPEGAGKTSVIRQIKEVLLAKYGEQELVFSREPGGSQVSEQIRQIIQPEQDNGMDARTEALLFAAARRQHLVDVIKPALAANKTVILDRYLDSSLAYQGGGRQLGVDHILAINQFATEGLLPDRTIYLDVPVTLGLQRIAQNRTNKIDRLDKEDIAFHERVRQTYLELLQQDPERIISIDASQNFEQVVLESLVLVEKELQS